MIEIIIEEVNTLFKQIIYYKIQQRNKTSPFREAADRKELKMNTIIKNLTPHTLNILNPDFSLKMEIPSEGGNPLRVATNSETVGEINGISIKRTTYGKCAELPEQEDGVYLVVSRMVIDAHPERIDLICPNEIVRKDADGNFSSHPFAKGDIVGCLSLSR